MPRRADRDLRRRPPRREPRRRILLVCEGQVTEPRYFRALRSEVRNPLVEIEIEGRGATPKTLVERAVERKREAEREAKSQRDEFLRYDEIWCVFDVDSHEKLADARYRNVSGPPGFNSSTALRFGKSAEARLRRGPPCFTPVRSLHVRR